MKRVIDFCHRLIASSIAAGLIGLGFVHTACAGKTENVVLVTSDGVRWREVFGGADLTLLNEKDGGVWEPVAELERRFGGADPQLRRRRLFPFLWSEVAAHGQLLGNRDVGSIARISNAVAVSYPGYNEMLSGLADPKITGNEFGPNPNVTVLEWLNSQPEFRGRVDVFAAWSAFHDILGEQRSHLPVRAGATLVDDADRGPQGQLLTELYNKTTRVFGDDPYDSFVSVALREHLKKHHPRVLFVGFGDTDLFQHLGRYDSFLESAHAFDGFLASLWSELQAIPQYHGKTTLIVTTDHGRGSGPVDWKDHGAAQPGSDEIWLGILGPDTAASGVRSGGPDIVQAQIAATIAEFLGKDFLAFKPEAAHSLVSALSPAGK